jgi:hypothetical protein
MASRRKKTRVKSKAKKPLKKKAAKKGGAGGAKGKAGKAAGKKKVGAKVKKTMTVRELKRELEKIANILAALDGYFAKFPDGSSVGGGGRETGPLADGGECRTPFGDPVNPVAVMGAECAPPGPQPQPGSTWTVFKKTLSRMSVTIETLIEMLAGMDPKMKI